MLSKKEILYIFNALSEEFNDNVDTELFYDNNYQLLVAIMLSAQATDKSVNNITDKLFKIIKTPQDTIKLGFSKLNEYIKTINYHNTKAQHILKASQQIIDNFNSKVPQDFNSLISLSGVGRKTANLMMSIAFKQPYIAVDTHVFRVANRIGMVDAKNVLQTELQLLKNVPVEKHRQINSLLIPFGRKYCKALNPKCHQCKFQKICKYYLTNNQQIKNKKNTKKQKI